MSAAPRLFRNVRLGVKTLLLHKLRSSLTMLGVVFGVGAVISMLAVGEGASREALEQIRKLGSQNIIITSQKSLAEASAGTQRTRMSWYGLAYEDEQRILDAVESVDAVVPAKIVRAEARLGERALELRVVGTSPQWFDLVDRDMIAGRTLNENDFVNRASVAVLTEHGARRLLATRGTIGQPVRIGNAVYEVVGIVRSETGQGQGMQTPDRDVDAYIPLQVARDRFGDVYVERRAGSRSRELVELHQLIVRVRSLEEVESAAAAIERLLEIHHPKRDWRMSVPLALLRQAEATQRTFSIVLGSIAGISLLVGGIGIMNIMLASVTERTREIGVRRAIGARKKQIIGQFLIETVVLSTVGGLIGVAIGLAIPLAITAFADMPTSVAPWSVALSLGISMAVGIVFGLYPAVRAANLDPIVALRHE
ncbi:MAG: ABC transporter permease [Planctomycetota bacterium]